MITAAGSGSGWADVLAAVAAAADVRAAAVVIGAPVPAAARPYLAAALDLNATDLCSEGNPGPKPGPGATPVLGAKPDLGAVRDVVTALYREHELVLIAAGTGPLMPLGADGWTLADLAVAVRASAVVAAGGGTDTGNQVTLTLAALQGQGIASTVVTVGDVDEEALPVTPAARLPAGLPDGLANAANWFDPALRTTPLVHGHRTAAARLGRPVDGTAFSGRHIVLALVALFVLMVGAACLVGALTGSGGPYVFRTEIG